MPRLSSSALHRTIASLTASAAEPYGWASQVKSSQVKSSQVKSSQVKSSPEGWRARGERVGGWRVVCAGTRGERRSERGDTVIG